MTGSVRRPGPQGGDKLGSLLSTSGVSGHGSVSFGLPVTSPWVQPLWAVPIPTKQSWFVKHFFHFSLRPWGLHTYPYLLVWAASTPLGGLTSHRHLSESCMLIPLL